MFRAIASIAQSNRIADIVYQKGSEPPYRRVVEPYLLEKSRYAILIRCFQLEPQSGWRIFKESKILEVRDTGRSFVPRRPVRFDLSILESRRHPKGPEYEYTAILSDYLSDLEINDGEACELQRIQRDLGLSDDAIRGVHCQLFGAAIGEVNEDGKVDDDEAEYLRRYRHCLIRAGWCP